MNRTNEKQVCLMALIMALAIGTQGQSALSRIIENQKYGFIDSNGMVIIPAIFNYLGDFSEGLAVARAEGKYGYIDKKGQFAISPKFEHAQNFSNGRALVYDNKEMFFINKQGKKVIPQWTTYMDKFIGGFAEITAVSGKKGLIDTMGKLAFDTIFHSIGGFYHGVAVFTRLNKIDGHKEHAVMDKKGKLIVPFGTYSDINGFKMGIGKVTAKDQNWEGLIDTLGNLLFRLEHTQINLYEARSLNAIKVIRKIEIGGKLKDYPAIIDQNGQFIIDNPSFQNIFPFSMGRAFVADSNRHYFLIDTFGQRVDAKQYFQVLDGQFVNGLTWVRVLNQGWNCIDTKGNTVIYTKLDKIARIPGSSLLKYTHTVYDKNWNVVNYQYGLASQTGEVLTPAIYEEVNPHGFQNGLLLVKTQNQYHYLDKMGKVRWVQSPQSHTNCTLNIDRLIYNHFSAASSPHSDDIGGFGTSKNIPRNIRKKHHFAPNQLSINIRNDLSMETTCNWGVYVSNLSGQKHFFQAQENHLYIHLQAKNQEGEWKNINFWFDSDCGNSYHTMTLPHGQYWGFPLPTFEGVFSTVLRAKLEVADQVEDVGLGNRVLSNFYIYSNEIKTNINLGQFWNGDLYLTLDVAHPYRN